MDALALLFTHSLSRYPQRENESAKLWSYPSVTSETWEASYPLVVWSQAIELVVPPDWLPIERMEPPDWLTSEPISSGIPLLVVALATVLVLALVLWLGWVQGKQDR